MTAAKIAKECGIKSIKEMAEYLGYHHNSLSRMYNDNPKKFTIMAMGVAAHMDKYKDTEFIYIGGVKYKLGSRNGKLAVAKV